MAALRKTPTQSNGGSDNGVTYTNLVDAEVVALWKISAELLTVVGSSSSPADANAIEAQTDATLVGSLTAITAGKAFWLVPDDDNTGAVTIEIDGLAAENIKDINGAALQESALVADRLHLIVFDGTDFRLFSTGSSGGASGSDYGVNGGRLTVSTGVAVLTAAATAQETLYWTPYRDDRIGLYDGAAWSVLAQTEKSIKVTDAQTGTTHNGTKVIDGLTDTSQLVPGMKISGTGVGAAAVIDTVDSATQVTATVNSTATAAVTVTFKCPANTGYDVYGKNVSSALKLFMVARSAIHTATANTTQNGVVVKSTDTTLRHLGSFQTSNTDGQIDYSLSGRYRFSVWNRDNQVYRDHSEVFQSTGTWYKSLCTKQVVSHISGGGGAGGGSGVGGAGSAGGTSSFGSHHSATGGAAGPNVDTSATAPARGTATGGDADIHGGGSPGGIAAGTIGTTNNAISGAPAALSIKTIAAAALGATETATVGAGGTSPVSTPGGQGGNGYVEVHEVLES